MNKNILIISSLKEMNDFSKELKRDDRKIAFVPTMGALHEGHLSLVSKANQLADHTVVSIFVNPTQFGENEDFNKYKRDLMGDIEKLTPFKIDAVFSPKAEDIYHENFQTYVEVTGLQEELCGKSRPGHFRGVATVVLKLFNIVLPDYAVFGQKDFQQLKIIERFVKDLYLDVKIVPMPIVREEDGLALSSRNEFLSEDERASAVSLSKALSAIHVSFQNGCRDAESLVLQGEEILQNNNVTNIDYLEIRDTENLELIKTAQSGNLVAVAARIGNARLIDNIIL